MIYFDLAWFITLCTCFHLYLFWFQSLPKNWRSLWEAFATLNLCTLQVTTGFSLWDLWQGWHYDIGHRVCVTGLGQKANKRQLQAGTWSTWTLGILGCLHLSSLQLWQEHILLQRYDRCQVSWWVQWNNHQCNFHCVSLLTVQAAFGDFGHIIKIETPLNGTAVPWKPMDAYGCLGMPTDAYGT